jgi:hypothetical protein
MRPAPFVIAVVAVTLVVAASWASPASAADAAVTLTVAVVGDGVGTVVSDPEGIACPGDCDESFAEGTPVTLTATPEYGSALRRWSACEGTSTCEVTLDGDLLVEASFDVVVFPALCVPSVSRLCGTPGDDLLVVNPNVDVPVTVMGGAGNDWIIGGPNADTIIGGDGADRIFGRGGADTLKGGAGPDSLVGGPGADRCYS